MNEPSEAWCYEMLRRARWPAGIACPRCGRRNVTTHSKFPATPRRRYVCLGCRRTFTDLTGTPFARTNLRLSTWFHWLSLTEESHTTSALARRLGVKWDTIAHLERRLAYARDHSALVQRLRRALQGSEAL